MQFVSLVSIGYAHNITYTGKNPISTDFFLERRSPEGIATDW
jgi:hypothetical protein